MGKTKKASEIWAVAPIKFADKMKEIRAIEQILVTMDYHKHKALSIEFEVFVRI